jgi:hypothetical protein
MDGDWKLKRRNFTLSIHVVFSEVTPRRIHSDDCLRAPQQHDRQIHDAHVIRLAQ